MTIQRFKIALNAARFPLVSTKGHRAVFFVGLAVFMGLAGIDQPTGVCAASAGVAGHMATRLLFAVERAVEARLD